MDNKRSGTVTRNIIFSFALKGIGIIISFLLLPLSVHYLSNIEYGVWVTLFSVMSWVNFLDMGIGLGLRNRLAEAVSRGDLGEIRAYISTGFFAIVTMGVIMLTFFCIVLCFVNLQAVFNTIEISEIELYNVVFLTGLFVILTFVLSIINQIYYAYQKASMTGAIQLTYNLAMLIIVYYLTLQPNHKLVNFIIGFGIASLFSRIIFILKFFIDNKKVCPRFSYINLKKLKSIYGLGVKFFIIQLACIAMFSASNLLITQCLGPENVRTYDIVFKIFSIITMMHGLICAPLWDAYTDAYIKDDFFWMRKIVRKMQYIMIPIIFCT